MAVLGGEAPVGDHLARTRRSAEQNSEGEGLARGKGLVADGRLGGGHDLGDGSRAAGVNLSHVVTTHELDGAASGPGNGALVSEDPSLLKGGVGRENSAIGNAVSNEDSTQVSVAGLAGSLGLGSLGSLGLSGLLDNGLMGDLAGPHADDGLSSISAAISDGHARLVTHGRHLLTIGAFAGGGDTDLADGGLELDDRVSLVVGVLGVSLAAGAEVNILADGALEADATDVGGRVVVLADGSITAHTSVNRELLSELGGVVQGDGIVDGHESVLGVDSSRERNALGAQIPIRAIQALVTNTNNELQTALTSNSSRNQHKSATYLVAVVADGVVRQVATRVNLLLEVLRDLGSKNGGLKSVLGVVAVNVLVEARVAKVKVLAVLAVKELSDREF